jgi:predicted nucleotidyltransferase
MGMIYPNMGLSTLPRSASLALPAGLANALFSKVQQRVMGILFGNPGRSFYANEIIAFAASGTGAVQRELTKLTAVGLITVSRRGNQKHYQANASSPIFKELRTITIKTFGLADVLRVALSSLAPQTQCAFVYGSVAKQVDTASSDIDLMVVSDTLSYADVFSAVESATRVLGREINPTVYTQKDFARKVHEGQSFLARVIKQPKIWLIGDEHDIAA